MAAKPLPDGYHNLTPYLIVNGADRFLEFLKQAFGAKEIERHQRPDGAIMHAEARIGDSVLMLADVNQQYSAMPAALYLYVEDTDAVYQRALKQGATSLMEPANQFYGDRNAGITDAWGNRWWIATHVEDVSREELEKRMKAHAPKVA